VPSTPAGGRTDVKQLRDTLRFARRLGRRGCTVADCVGDLVVEVIPSKAELLNTDEKDGGFRPVRWFMPARSMMSW
jgi:hypothetical protein